MPYFPISVKLVKIVPTKVGLSEVKVYERLFVCA